MNAAPQATWMQITEPTERLTVESNVMNIILTPKQEKFLQAKLLSGKYRNAEEVLELAFRLLDEYEQADAAWINYVGKKIDAAIAMSEQTPPIDGKTFVNQILEHFQQVREAPE